MSWPYLGRYPIVKIQNEAEVLSNMKKEIKDNPETTGEVSDRYKDQFNEILFNRIGDPLVYEALTE